MHQAVASQEHSCTRFCCFRWHMVGSGLHNTLLKTHTQGAVCRPLFGNVYTCISSGNVHVCDQNCRVRACCGTLRFSMHMQYRALTLPLCPQERIYFDSHNEICRLSKKLFPFPVHGSAAGLGRPER